VCYVKGCACMQTTCGKPPAGAPVRLPLQTPQRAAVGRRVKSCREVRQCASSTGMNVRRQNWWSEKCAKPEPVAEGHVLYTTRLPQPYRRPGGAEVLLPNSGNRQAQRPGNLETGGRAWGGGHASATERVLLPWWWLHCQAGPSQPCTSDLVLQPCRRGEALCLWQWGNQTQYGLTRETTSGMSVTRALYIFRRMSARGSRPANARACRRNLQEWCFPAR